MPERRNVYKSRLVINAIFFTIFFAYYLWVAIVNTPVYKDFAALPCMGMPLGMFLSLSIFPVSGILIFLYFKVWR